MKRLVHTNRETVDCAFPKPEFRPGPKPFARNATVWYSLGEGWREFAAANLPQQLGGNTFEIEIDNTRIKTLATLDDLRDFTARYQADDQGSTIDWPRVSADFSGIEIQLPCLEAYLNDSEIKASWMEGWDFAQGCMWDSGAILKATKYEQSSAPDTPPHR